MMALEHKNWLYGLFALIIIGTILIGVHVQNNPKRNHESDKSQPEKTYSEMLVLDTLLPGTYDDADIKLEGDTIIEHGEQLIINNSRIDLNNHSLIFREGSNGIITNSIILNASEEYWDGYVSRNPDKMEKIMQSEKGWGIRPSAGLGIETDNFVLDNSIIRNSYGHGIYFYYAKNPEVTNCRFIGNAWSALRSEGSWGIYFVNNTLEGNAWQNPDRVGFAQVDVSAGGNLTFSHNRIFTASVTEGAACFYGQKGMLMEYNEFDDIILIDNCNDCIIKNNKAKQLSIYGGKNIVKENKDITEIFESDKNGPEAWRQ